MQLHDLIDGLLAYSKKIENCMNTDQVYDFERHVDQGLVVKKFIWKVFWSQY
jgi:hypothetical protein